MTDAFKSYQLAALTTAGDAPDRRCHYAVAMEERGAFECRCCDYADARLSFFKPGMDLPLASGTMTLSFHESLVRSSALRLHFADYSFFGYRHPLESLYISLRERAVASRLFDSVAEELAHGDDQFTATLLAEKINLLLTNCRRFYQRQFIMREDYCAMHVAKAEKIVDAFYAEGHGCDIPPIDVCAEQMKTSAAYATDVIRFITGKTFREFAQLRQLHMAKHLLSSTDRTVPDIARSLGFPSTACFEEFFSIVAGTSATAFRQSRC